MLKYSQETLKKTVPVDIWIQDCFHVLYLTNVFLVHLLETSNQHSKTKFPLTQSDYFLYIRDFWTLINRRNKDTNNKKLLFLS